MAVETCQGFLFPQKVRRGPLAEALFGIQQWPAKNSVPGMRSQSEPFRQPDFDDRLPGDPQPFCFPIEGVDHPDWKIDIHPSLLSQGPAGTAEFEAAADIPA